jgi:L-2-hydroxyglutarate oxidase
MIGGQVHAGPNAVLAFQREGYHKRDVALRDLTETLTYSGFWRLARRHWRVGAQEMMRSLSKASFVRSLQRLVPEIVAEDLVDAPAGVRAQALDPRGNLIDDFLIASGRRSIHVCNAPSPAATASIALGQVIAERVQDPSLLRSTEVER